MFNRFYDQTIQESRCLTEEPKLPRNQKLPHRIDHGLSAPHHHLCAKDKYRQIYYEAIDTVTEEVKRRFDQSDNRVIREIENLLLNSANGTTTDALPQEITDILVGDVDVERLKVQLGMLPDLIKTALEGTIKRVTNVRTIADAMVKSEIYCNMLSEVKKSIFFILHLSCNYCYIIF